MHQRDHQISIPVDTSTASASTQRPDPEVVPGAKRRTFSKAGKLRILAAADACNAPGDIGAPKRGPKPDPAAAQERKVRELENEVARLRDKLAKADLIIDVQKKLSILLGLSTASTLNEPK